MTLTLSDFSDLIDAHFPARVAENKLTFTLVEAKKGIGGIPGGREPFTLLFRGPSKPLLAQGIYQFDHPRRGAIEIFIVPIAADAQGISYEAVFG